MKSINLKFTLFLYLIILFLNPTFAQYVCSEKLYTILPGEKIIFEDEHRLLTDLDETNHMIFTQIDSLKFIIFNGKRFGPFDYIEQYESNRSLLDWGVMKSGKWYEVILDKDQILGPYDEVSDVFRDQTNKHYGVRVKTDSLWYVIIDGKRNGPYKEVSQFYPKFSAKGGNWMIEAKPPGQQNSSLFTKYGPGPLSTGMDKYDVYLNETGYDFIHRNYTAYSDGWGYNMYLYSGNPNYTYSYDASDISSLDYHMQGKYEDKGYEDRYNDSIVFENSANRINGMESSGFSFDDAHAVTIFKASLLTVNDNKGNRFGPFNNCFDFDYNGGNNIYSAENYFVKKNNRWVPIYRNVNKEEKKDFFQLPPIDLRKESFLIVNDKKYGPFEHIINYSNRMSDNGHYAAVINKDRELFLDGALTNIKHVKYFTLDNKTGNCFSVDDNDEYWLNKKKLGRIGFQSSWSGVNIVYSDDGNNYAYTFQNAEGYYIYSSVADKNYGPYKFPFESMDWAMSSDGNHIAVANPEGIFIDDKQVAPSGSFSLVFSGSENCFIWLTLMGRDIFKDRYSFYRQSNE